MAGSRCLQALIALTVGAVLLIPGALAHPYYRVSGPGIDADGDADGDESKVRVEVVRRPREDNRLNHTPGLDPLALFEVRIFVDGEVVQELSFEGNDTYYDHADDAFMDDPTGGPSPVRPYHAEATEDGVDFELDGVQVAKTISATGTVAGYRVTVDPFVL